MIPHLIISYAWFYTAYDATQYTQFSIDWSIAAYLRNIALLLVIAGGLHLYFYTYKKQGMEQKFDLRTEGGSGKQFLFNRQLWDNIFWSCISGVLIWTLFELAMLWGHSNGLFPGLEWSQSPVWFVLLFILIPFFNSVHFYTIHRVLHTKWLFDRVHRLHHHNVNIGPWSGIAMHPVEHFFYLSSVLIHAVVPSSPVHIFFHLSFLTLGAVTSHTGFSGFIVNGKNVFELGSFFHQLHHRYFNFNFGNKFVPCDKWFGSIHDGTEASMKKKPGSASLDQV